MNNNFILIDLPFIIGFSVGSAVMNLSASAEVFNLGSGRSPGKENGNPFPHLCLGNLTYRATLRDRVQGIAKTRTLLNNINDHS